MRIELLAVLPLAALFGQTPRATFRATTELVQVDAVVTDSKGQPVRDLAAGDFQIYQDGKLQKVRSCTWIDAGTTRPGQAAPELRRVVLLVDDLNLTAPSRTTLHNGLLKFVNEQMQPGDAAAIAVASRGGLFQNFTSDRALLLQSIERIPWILGGTQKLDPVERMGTDPTSVVLPEWTAPSAAYVAGKVFSSGAIALANALGRLAAIPGRKSLIIFSDGDPVPGNAAAYATFANRGSTVVYHIDTRGIAYAGFVAADQTTVFGRTLSPFPFIDKRSNELGLSQLGGGQLPTATGGFAIQNSNDFSGSIQRVLDDMRGYYLLTYQPAAESLDDPAHSYHKLEVKVSTHGLKVRSRDGFFVAQSAGLHLKLTPFIWRTGNQPLDLKAYLHVDANELTFTTDSAGTRHDAVGVLLTAFDPAGSAVQRVEKQLDLNVKADEFDSLVRYGLVTTIDLPAMPPGLYWIGANVKDRASGKAGETGQPLNVPDLNAGPPALSPIQLMTEGKGFSTVSTAALRRFKRGQVVSWYCQVFRRERIADQTALVELSSASGEVVSSTPFRLKAETIHGTIHLGEKLSPGEYVFRIANGDLRQTADLEIVE